MTDFEIMLDKVELRVGAAAILGPITLSIAPGEHVLVVGPSGSGKTSLLRAIAGLHPPHSGRVLLAGGTASDGPGIQIPPAQRQVGMLFQNGAHWPHMSVHKALSFVMQQAKINPNQRQDKIRRLLDLVELTGKEDRKPGTLSGGEAQRLALARALAGEPRILLLDEPLGPLDAELRLGLLDRLDEVQRELALTVLHVTHDPGEARSISGRTLELEGGLITGEEHHG